MATNDIIKGIEDVLGSTDGRNRMLRMIRCAAVDARSVRSRFSSEMYIDAATVLLVTAGEMRIEVNRRMLDVGAGRVVVLFASHLFRAVSCSDDFSGLCLMVGEEFMNEMDSVDMIYRRIRYGVKLYDKPVVTLPADGTALVTDRLLELRQAIDNTAHLYYRDVVLNRLFAFYLDLSDIIDRSEASADRSEHTARYESIVKRFIELLTSHYRSEHTVGFYASQLNISAHYLTLIVKEVTGRSVSDFIFGMLYGDARALLAESRMSVQEITALLNFSDQSAFGKFFKRRSGLSPLEYRKKRH